MNLRLISAGIFALLLSSSCENDLKDVEKISAKTLSVPVDRSTGVEVIYSDSAQVKARVIAAELLHFKTDKPYYEMKKGVEAHFFDANGQETSKITANYAISRELEKKIELQNNVVVTSKDGKVFKSDQLVWDENRKRFYSDKLVTIITPGQQINGTSFWATEDFSYYEIRQSTANFEVKQ